MILLFLLIAFCVLAQAVSSQGNDTKEIVQQKENKTTPQNTTFSEFPQKSYVETEELIEAQRSFDRSLSILNIVATLMGVLVGLITLIAAIAIALGFFEYNKWKSIRKDAEKEANFIRDIRDKAETELNKLRNEIEKTLSTEKQLSKEEMKKLDEFTSRLELIEMLGISLKPEDYFYRGIDLFQKGKYEYSLQAFEKTLELRPDFAEAWHNKGLVLTKLGRAGDAHKAFEEAGKLNPIFAQRYLFSWDEIPGNDSGKLIEFLERIFGIDWIKTAKIVKTNDGKTINVYTEKKSLSLTLNDEKTRVHLKIDEQTYLYTAEIMNGKLNIYTGITKDYMVSPFKKQ